MENRLQQVLNAIALPFSSLKKLIFKATAISGTVSNKLRKTDCVEDDCDCKKTSNEEFLKLREDRRMCNEFYQRMNPHDGLISIPKSNIDLANCIKPMVSHHEMVMVDGISKHMVGSTMIIKIRVD